MPGMTLGRVLALVVAVVLVVAGGLFALQGMGYLEGSEMTDVSFWAVAGSVMAGFGIALAIVTLQKR